MIYDNTNNGKVATADPELTRDPRFKELQRRWVAR